MKKDSKLKITSYLMAILVASSVTLAPSPVKADGETIITIVNANENNEVTKIKLNIDDIIAEEERSFCEYKVVCGDNASIISKKVCKIFGIPVTTKYWPVIAFLNEYPRVINPGDIIIYPNSPKFLDELLDYVNTSGWLEDYLNKHDVYKRRSTYILDDVVTAGQVFDSIYGLGASKNKELFNLYLDYIGESGKFTPSTILVTGDDYFRFTEDIPTMDELNNYRNHKNK